MTDKVRVFFNPACSKCRAARELVDGRVSDATYVKYLDDAPSRSELEAVVRMLGLTSPRGMMRTSERIYGELGLADADDERLIDAMTKHPILIERPIVIRGERAVIARPPSKVLELFDDDVSVPLGISS